MTTSRVGRQVQTRVVLNLSLLIDVCRRLGVPLAEEKIEGPTTLIIFLGILIDSVRVNRGIGFSESDAQKVSCCLLRVSSSMLPQGCGQVEYSCVVSSI